MKTIEFIKNIKSSNTAAKFYFIEKQVHTDDDSGNSVAEWLPEVYFTEEEARAAIAALLPTLEADFGEYLSINLVSGTVEPEDLDYIDWENIDAHGDEWFDSSDLFNIIKENDSRYDIDYFYVEYEYESLEGCILVFWSWQTHVGYCRKCEDIRYGYSNETSKMCVPQDRCYRTQCSVLCEAKELEGLSREEINDLVHEKLNDSNWKWQNNAHYIADFACL